MKIVLQDGRYSMLSNRSVAAIHLRLSSIIAASNESLVDDLQPVRQSV